MPNFEVNILSPGGTQKTRNKRGIFKSIRAKSNPYVGNKKKIIPFIDKMLEKHNVQFSSVLDAFSGSSSVSLYFKKIGKNVIANDLLTSSYMNAVSLVENDGVKLTKQEVDFLLNSKNENASTFVRDNWTKTFTSSEAEKLDNFRANVRDLSNEISQSISFAANELLCMRLPFGFVDRSIDIYSHRKKQLKAYGPDSQNHDRRIGIYYDESMDLDFNEWFPKYVKLYSPKTESGTIHDLKIKHNLILSSMHDYLFRKAFKGGRFYNAQVLMNVDFRTSQFGEMGFSNREFMKASIFDPTKQNDCIATNCDAIELMKSGIVNVDCVYFDPPYGGNSSDYATLYRFFEEYIYEDKLENLPHYQYMNRFSNRNTYSKHFNDLLSSSNYIPIWLFSYNDSSWTSIENIVDIIKSFKKSVIVESLEYEYNYRDVKKNKVGTEYFIIAM